MLAILLGKNKKDSSSYTRILDSRSVGPTHLREFKMDLQKYADQGTTAIIEAESIRLKRNIEIEIDEFDPTKVWIYMIEEGQRVEGGTFDSNAFMNHVLKFYNEHY